MFLLRNEGESRNKVVPREDAGFPAMPPVTRITENYHYRTTVPSFIYRKPNGTIGIHESLFATADAFILVYNIRDRKSFDVLSRIRQEIRTARGCSCTTNEIHKVKGKHNGGSRGSRASCVLCSCKDIPSLVVVGTHMVNSLRYILSVSRVMGPNNLFKDTVNYA